VGEKCPPASSNRRPLRKDFDGLLNWRVTETKEALDRQLGKSANAT
jgi:hypothetical protein